MKKSISVNIKGTVFNIEEDAFEVLKSYLDSVKKYFSNYEDSTEIYDDIEARIAEILHGKLSKTKEVITMDDVESVIETMGKVEDFAEQEDEFQSENESKQNTSSEESSTTNKKRFYRDTKRQIVSGVCSGIGHYFAIDPFWIRLVFVLSFFLTGFVPVLVAYAIFAMILPKNDTLEETKVKKLYRDGEDAVLGGVSSGIAKFFGTDPVIIRILFVLAFILGGFGLITYLIIWIITPEAKTRSEKMQMEGEPVTIENIEKNIKDNLNLKDQNGDESTLATILLFPFRIIAQILNGVIKLLKPFSLFLLQLFRFVGGFSLLSIGLLLMFVFFMILAVGVGIISGEQIYTSPDIPVEVFAKTVSGYSMIAAFFTGFFPSLLFVLLGISLFVKRSIVKPIIFGSIVGLWIISIGFLIGSAAFIAKDFNRESKITKKEILDVNSGELLIELSGNDTGLDDVELMIKPTSDSSFKLVQTIEAKGASSKEAKENAENVIYNYTIENNILKLNESITYDESSIFRDQEVSLKLYVPVGKSIRIHEDAFDIMSKRKFVSSPSIYSDFGNMLDFKDRVWVSTNDNFECSNCDDVEIIEEDEHEDSSLSWDGTSNTYELKDFSKIQLSDAFEVKIEQGDEYQVKVIADEEDLENVDISKNDDWLNIDYSGGDKYTFKFNLSDLKDIERKVKVFIQAPNINELEIGGACTVNADLGTVSSFAANISGASEANIDIDAADVCSINLSGASEATLSGITDVLQVDVSGASSFEGFRLNAKNVIAEASGASEVEVNAADKLEAEASGMSTIKYKGNPELDIDENGLSEIKQK